MKRRVLDIQPKSVVTLIFNVCRHKHTHTHTHTYTHAYRAVTHFIPMHMSSTDTSDSYDDFFQIDNSKLPEMPIDGAVLHLSCGIRWNIAPSTSIPFNSQLSLEVRLQTVFIEPSLYFSKHKQSFNLSILITYVCGQQVFLFIAVSNP